ncbi:hypothetical protein B0T24DRAFT_286679 [Lasiosphaeria ovina]|uniref:Uncharacterized protein n=1 Tax=Lasiosphaeria ovina TaxID=92902 RepID=A0AAE0N7X0_9PEZI|nr:hypothetical protein B0T24DRAFT_286679 [Lasiosphaeria ovina]
MQGEHTLLGVWGKRPRETTGFAVVCVVAPLQFPETSWRGSTYAPLVGKVSQLAGQEGQRWKPRPPAFSFHVCKNQLDWYPPNPSRGDSRRLRASDVLPFCISKCASADQAQKDGRRLLERGSIGSVHTSCFSTHLLSSGHALPSLVTKVPGKPSSVYTGSSPFQQYGESFSSRCPEFESEMRPKDTKRYLGRQLQAEGQKDRKLEDGQDICGRRSSSFRCRTAFLPTLNLKRGIPPRSMPKVKVRARPTLAPLSCHTPIACRSHETCRHAGKKLDLYAIIPAKVRPKCFSGY